MSPAIPATAPELISRLKQWETRALIAAAAALILSLLGAFRDSEVFFHAWLMAWLIWLGVSLGCLSLNMLQYVTGGQWGVVARRIFEAGSRTLPLLAMLFIPVLFGMKALYPWTHPDIVAGDPVLRYKHPYLNVPFFVIRAVLYFSVWTGLAWLLTKSGEHQNQGVERSRARLISALGLVLYVFSMTFAATDWAQSLQPHWYSTVWGFLFVAGQGLSAMSFSIGAMLLLARWQPMLGIVRQKHIHDLGKLMFMFVMLWAYLSFSQLLIIWTGNLPEEIPWYVHRLSTNWVGVGIALLLFQFLFPFLLLLSRPLKRHAGPLLTVAALVFFMRFVDIYWIVVPDIRRGGLFLHWLHFACLIGIGAAWIAMWLWQLRTRSLLPENDPRLTEVVLHA